MTRLLITSFVEPGMHAMHVGLLKVASVLTPRGLRVEWRREWQAELWHVRRECAGEGALTWQAERTLTAFCLGAFQDALCLRRDDVRKGVGSTAGWLSSLRLASFKGSAVQCVFALVVVLAVSWGLSVALPGVDVESHPARYRVNPNLILIQATSVGDSAATITARNFEAWKGRRQKYFDGFAFYRMARETVGNDARTRLEVAHASTSLLSLVGTPVRFRAAVDGDLPAVILSDGVWRRDFGGDPHVVGSVVWIGRREARIAGVAPAGAWRLPGKPDAWLLESDATLAGVGYVVAHLTKMGQAEMLGERVHITANNSDDADDDLWGVSFAERTRGPQGIYRFAIFLALLALPAITSVSMGEYSFNAHRLSWGKKLTRWGFLLAKIALLLPIVYFVSLDLAYWSTGIDAVSSQYIQLLSSFVMCLFGMRWILLDQRQRCPVCLRRVTHPARVGLASRTFLAWNGTELMCMGGHTLLHVPELPTSWFSTQRWLYLDTSWDFLFAGSGIG